MDRLSTSIRNGFAQCARSMSIAALCALIAWIAACGEASCPAGSISIDGRCEPATECPAGATEDGGVCVADSPSSMGDAASDDPEAGTDLDSSVTESTDPLCATFDCGDHGACQVERTVARCICDDGYQGAQCDGCVAGLVAQGDTCITPCDADNAPRCDEDRVCDDSSGRAICVCDAAADDSCNAEDCRAATCDANETCVAGPTCMPTCSLDDSCELGEACLDATDCETGSCIGRECRPGCGPTCADAQPCVANADCSSGYCARDDATSLAGICRPACARAGCGTAEPCTRDADCSAAACNGGLCQPSCGTACQPGDACATSTNCAGADICDEVGHVCLTSCSNPSGDYVLTSAADFTNARHCSEIDDNLTISANFPTVTTDHLPYLREVRGSLTLTGGTLLEITLPRLEHIDNEFVAAFGVLERIFLPSLDSMGSFGGSSASFTVAMAVATEIHAPKLRIIYGSLLLQTVPNLTSVRFDSLASVSGKVSIIYASTLTTLNLAALDARSDVIGSIQLKDLPKLPWSAVSPMAMPLRGGEDISNIGCDTTSSCNCGNTSCVPAP